MLSAVNSVSSSSSTEARSLRRVTVIDSTPLDTYARRELWIEYSVALSKAIRDAILRYLSQLSYDYPTSVDIDVDLGHMSSSGVEFRRLHAVRNFDTLIPVDQVEGVDHPLNVFQTQLRQMGVVLEEDGDHRLFLCIPDQSAHEALLRAGLLVLRQAQAPSRRPN